MPLKWMDMLLIPVEPRSDITKKKKNVVLILLILLLLFYFLGFGIYLILVCNN